MSFEDVTRRIESHDFAGVVGIANDREMFIRIAQEQPEVQKLLVHLLQSEESQRRLLLRIASLLREQEDVRYRSSRDAAVAIYLLALYSVNKGLGLLAATDVISAPRFWWARKAATRVLSSESSQKTRVSSRVSQQTGWKITGPTSLKDILVVDQPMPTWFMEGSRILASKDIDIKASTSRDQIQNESKTLNVSSSATIHTDRQ